jgi:hypothetical protein
MPDETPDEVVHDDRPETLGQRLKIGLVFAIITWGVFRAVERIFGTDVGGFLEGYTIAAAFVAFAYLGRDWKVIIEAPLWLNDWRRQHPH